MNGLTPNCLNDFLFSNLNDRETLEWILSRKLPFPLGGKSGILLHGTWGTGKSTLAKLLPGLLEMSYSESWNMTLGVGSMPPPSPDHCQTTVFRCGGGLSSTTINQTINMFNTRYPLHHFSKHDYFVFDELDHLTDGAQQSLRSTMDLKRCMFFFTTNNLNRIDRGIINRCHLVEMNQIVTPSAYTPLGLTILKNMGVSSDVVNNSALETLAIKARGSMRDYVRDIVKTGIEAGGIVP